MNSLRRKSFQNRKVSILQNEHPAIHPQEKKERVKIWQTVHWADSFPEEFLTMDSNDITPQFAITKITSLLESRRYEECNQFIARLNNLTVKCILTDLPIPQLHLAIPNSLSVLDCIYNKVHETSTTNFPIQYLRTDELLKNMVILFSQPTNSNNRDKNCNIFYPYCRNILRVIASVETEFLKMVKERRDLLSKSLKFLGQHGMVKSGFKTTGIKMISLHDALKIEFDRVILLYKSALHKLEEFSLSGKNPSETSVNTGPAPSEASHQRLLQVTRDNIQDRLIKNKTIYNVVEPVVTGQAVDNLIDILEKRIEYDKQILFQESELRKLYGCDKNNYVSVSIRQYLHGYNVLVQLLQEGCGLQTTSYTDEDGTMDEVYENNDVFKKPIRSRSLDVVDQFSGEDNHSGRERRKQPRISSPLLTGGLLGPNTYRRDRRESSPIYIPIADLDKDITRKTSRTSSDSGPVPKPRTKTSIRTPDMNAPYVRMSDVPVQVVHPTSMNSARPDTETVPKLQRQVELLQRELKQSKEEIRKLQEREKSLRERLSDHVQRKFSESNQHFENLSLGNKRPTELIRLYGNLYTDGRLDALDALDDLKDLEELSILKTKILFSIIVLTFRSTEELLESTKSKLRELLNIPKVVPETDKLSVDIQRQLDHYLQQTFDRFDLTSHVKNVCEQIYETLFDYPCLKQCEGLVQFVEECLQISLGLTAQNPSYIICYTDTVFQRDRHIRFHTSDPGTDKIKNFVWPCLLEGEGGICVSKGFVIT